jgi:hypothetical protein
LAAAAAIEVLDPARTILVDFVECSAKAGLPADGLKGLTERSLFPRLARPDLGARG